MNLVELAQMLPYTTEHGLGRALGAMYFHVREGDGTDEALKWDRVMNQHEKSVAAKRRQ